MKLRSFLAFDIPPKVKQAIGALIADLRAQAPEIKWAMPEQLHVTLRFFGSVEESLLTGPIGAAIGRVAEEETAHDLQCSGVGVFPNWKYPRIIWAGFSGDTEPTVRLHDRLAEALHTFPLKADSRAFRLHLTIGRAVGTLPKGTFTQTVERLSLVEFGLVPINHVTLYKSQLTRTGAIYTPITAYPFGQRT